jgi:hypothetical protein
VNVYFNPIQNLRLGGRVSKSRFQYVMKSVSAGELQDNADKLVALMRPDPMFRDVTSDAQMKGLQAQVNIDRDKANSLGVNIQDIRTALYSTFGERQVSTIYTSVDSYQVILQASDPDRRDDPRSPRLRARPRGSSCRFLERVHGRAQGGSALHQPRRAAAGDHGLVQPRGRPVPRRRREEDRALPPEPRHAGIDPGELGR